MIEYIEIILILVLILLVGLVLLNLKKKNEGDGDVYSKSDHEGFVLSNQYGTCKLVNREQFSYANFNSDRWNNK